MTELIAGLISQSKDTSFTHRLYGQTLAVSFSLPRLVLSWAAYHGGFRQQVSHIVIHQKSSTPMQSARQAASHLGLRGTVVGMTTQADLHYSVVTASDAELQACAITNVDCSNLASVGDPTNFEDDQLQQIHATAINIILITNYRFTQEAMLEALAISTEAKTKAMYEFGFRSRTGEPASGGKADCVAIAVGPERRYERCAKDTKWGELIGRASLEGVRKALAGC